MIAHEQDQNLLRTSRICLFAAGALCLSLILSSDAQAVESLDDEAVPSDCPTYISSETHDDPQALTMHGIACFEDEQYDWALTYYRRAYGLSGDPFLLGGIGRSLHELGLYEPAMRSYEGFLDSDEDHSGADRIRRRVDELETSMQTQGSEVSLQSTPAGATVYLVLDNGEWYQLGTAPVELKLQEGTYEFVFHRDHYMPRQIAATTTPEEPQRIDGRLVSESSGLSVSERRRRRAGVWTTTTGLGIGAAGGALLALSAHNNSAARGLQEEDFPSPSDYDERLQGHLDSAHTQRTWGIVATATGATILVTGMLLYFSGSPSGVAADYTAALTPGRLQFEPLVSSDSLGFRLAF